MSAPSGNLNRFIGLHSFLIGLFPFYIPVYLWKNGMSLGEISFFISLAGMGFCATLWIWDRLHKTVGFRKIISLSFALEVNLLLMIFFREHHLFIPLFALIYGAYSCFFWITQRVLFLDIINPTTSGRKFGNLQILVAVLLKSGIFVGGLLLDKIGFNAIFIFSSLVALSAIVSYSISGTRTQFPMELRNTRPIGFKDILTFKDHLGSRSMFIIDGLFLFLDSYFWLISVFLVVKESFLGLGVLVISLILVFTVFFWLIKNSIDRLPTALIFKTSVLLYAVSWALRGMLTESLENGTTLVLLVLITFFSSFFRLTFNKRFFDLAKSSSSHHYLILKSYLSQAAVIIWFGIIGLLLTNALNAQNMIRNVYFAAALIAGGYLIYGKKDQAELPEPLATK